MKYLRILFSFTVITSLQKSKKFWNTHQSLYLIIQNEEVHVITENVNVRKIYSIIQNKLET